MRRTKLKVGIIGCGAIGTEIARACQAGLGDEAELAAICDIDREKALLLNKSLKKEATVLGLEELIRNVDLAVEAASAAVSARVLEQCISGKRDCLVMSVGGLIGREDLLRSADEKGVKVYIPSGAICGIDGLKAASGGRIESVTLTTRKPPKGLAGAPYLKEKSIDVLSLKEETVIFEGDCLEAVKGFPQNINVSAVLSLAGIGPRRTRVRIITSPAYTANTHEVEIAGDFGKISTRTENVPSKNNPKTSALAIASAIAALKGAISGVRIGT